MTVKYKLNLACSLPSRLSSLSRNARMFIVTNTMVKGIFSNSYLGLSSLSRKESINNMPVLPCCMPSRLSSLSRNARIFILNNTMVKGMFSNSYLDLSSLYREENINKWPVLPWCRHTRLFHIEGHQVLSRLARLFISHVTIVEGKFISGKVCLDCLVCQEMKNMPHY